MEKIKKAFTLVELIVVITILAILAVISFISVQNYTIYAKNSKVHSNIKNLGNKMNIMIAEGNKPSFYIQNNRNQLTNLSVGGKLCTAGLDYFAGTINYNYLGVKKEDFLDNYGREYVVGVTTRLGNRFEVAGILEESGYLKNYVSGNYNPRKVGETLSTIVSHKSENSVGVNKTNNLYEGDYVITNGTGPSIVRLSKLNLTHSSGDMMTFSESIPNDSSSVMLAENETIGLLMGYDKNSGTGIIINGGEYLPYND